MISRVYVFVFFTLRWVDADLVPFILLGVYGTFWVCD